MVIKSCDLFGEPAFIFLFGGIWCDNKWLVSWRGDIIFGKYINRGSSYQNSLLNNYNNNITIYLLDKYIFTPGPCSLKLSVSFLASFRRLIWPANFDRLMRWISKKLGFWEFFKPCCSAGVKKLSMSSGSISAHSSGKFWWMLIITNCSHSILQEGETPLNATGKKEHRRKFQSNTQKHAT